MRIPPLRYHTSYRPYLFRLPARYSVKGERQDGFDHRGIFFSSSGVATLHSFRKGRRRSVASLNVHQRGRSLYDVALLSQIFSKSTEEYPLPCIGISFFDERRRIQNALLYLSLPNRLYSVRSVLYIGALSQLSAVLSAPSQHEARVSRLVRTANCFLQPCCVTR